MAAEANVFPTDTWLADMKSAVDRITKLGTLILDMHRRASDKAAQTADNWHLADRIEDERAALLVLIAKVRQIIETVVHCRQEMHAADAKPEQIHEAMERCRTAIESNLPDIEQAFATIRHSALDLLLWTRRAAKIEGSELPDAYRASYAQLVAYAPITKPLMAALQDDLLRLNTQSGLHPHEQRLISALNHYNAVAESARGFVKSVVEPPLELVFHEAETFVDDFQSFLPGQKAALATELNDCCQLLLYDAAAFHQRVEPVRPQLADGMDASMVVLTVDDELKVFLTVDEDPVFAQLVVTLLRVVPENRFVAALDGLTRDLYGPFTAD
jgi:hypothetical protein